MNENAPQGSFTLNEQIMKTSTVDFNVGQQVLVITADKLRLELREYSDSVKDAKIAVGCLGIALSLFTTLVAADFKPFMGIPVQFWQSAFIGSLILCAGFGGFTGIRAIVRRDRRNVEKVITNLGATKNDALIASSR